MSVIKQVGIKWRYGVFLLLAVCFLIGLWQFARYGTFGPTDIPSERNPQMIAPAQTVTLFGASNFSRGPLADHLQKALGACVRIRTVAKAGANSDWALAQIDRAFANGGIVVIAFTGNDSSLLRGMSLQRSVENHRILRQRAQNAGARVIYPVGTPEFHGLRGLVRPGAAAYIHAIADDAPEAGILDEGAFTRGQADLMPDGLHMTDDAIARYIAPTYAEAIRPLVTPCCHHPRSGSCR